LLVVVDEEQVRPFGRETFGGGQAQACGTSGDDDGLACETLREIGHDDSFGGDLRMCPQPTDAAASLPDLLRRAGDGVALVAEAGADTQQSRAVLADELELVDDATDGVLLLDLLVEEPVHQV